MRQAENSWALLQGSRKRISTEKATSYLNHQNMASSVSGSEVATHHTEPLKDDPSDEVTKLKASLQREKAAKRKMYSYLVKIADELKTLRNESEQLINAADYARKAWYEGGMWRGPNVLPGAYGSLQSGEQTSSSPGNQGDGQRRANEGGAQNNGGMGATGPIFSPRPPVSLSDLFLDLVTVVAFSRVGSAIQERGRVDTASLAYFATFWQIWSKEAAYSTRFDTTDISSHLETLLACFSLLAGSLSAFSDFHSAGCNRIMGVGMFVAFLHVALHARVWYWFMEGGESGSVNWSVKRYAMFTTLVNTLEMVNWLVGMSLPLESSARPWIFLVGVILNLRLPKGFMPNDFHGTL
jgi:hypothetical protein